MAILIICDVWYLAPIVGTKPVVQNDSHLDFMLGLLAAYTVVKGSASIAR
jgi:hypothetical protein